MRAVLAAIVGIALAGCSSAPSQPSAEDMRAAIQRSPHLVAGSMVWATIGSFFGAGSAEETRRRITVQKGDCVDARPNPGFVCDFALVLDGSRIPGGELRGRFFRIGTDWNVELMLR